MLSGGFEWHTAGYFWARSVKNNQLPSLSEKPACALSFFAFGQVDYGFSSGPWISLICFPHFYRPTLILMVS